jgi:uncharacterized protein
VTLRAIRVILDTNLWVSAIIRPNGLLARHVDALLGDKLISILVSTALVLEVVEVLSRPKHSKYVSEADLLLLEAQLKALAFVEVLTVVEEAPDPDDNFLLALCLDGKADYLLTGDKRLIEMQHFGSTRICSLTDFVSEMKMTLS